MTWDSRREPGRRVLGVWLLKPRISSNNQEVDEEPIERVAGGRKYKIVTREYMAQGHNGFSALTKGQMLIDHDSGVIMSSIVRKYLLGREVRFSFLMDFSERSPIGSQIVDKVQCDTSMVHQEPKGEECNGFDGHNNALKDGSCNNKVSLEESSALLVISPVIDGRVKDEGKE